MATQAPDACRTRSASPMRYEHAADVAGAAADRRQASGQRGPGLVAVPAGVEEPEPAAVEGERVHVDIAQRTIHGHRDGPQIRPELFDGRELPDAPGVVLGDTGDLHAVALCQGHLR
jgi:hypothetical protein